MPTLERVFRAGKFSLKTIFHNNYIANPKRLLQSPWLLSRHAWPPPSVVHSRIHWSSSQEAHLNRDVGAWRPRKGVQPQLKANERTDQSAGRQSVHGEGRRSRVVLQSTAEREANRTGWRTINYYWRIIDGS